MPRRQKSRPFRARSLLLGAAGVLLCTAAAASGEDASAEPDPGSGEILELRDEALIARLWEILYDDSLPLPGEYQVLIPPDPSPTPPPLQSEAWVYLLRNGTMEGRLDRMAWEKVAAFSYDQKVVRWKDDWEEPESEYIPTLWRSLDMDPDRLFGWIYWPYGFRFGMSSAMSMVPSSTPQFERRLDFEWNQKLFGHFLLGAGMRRVEYGGGLLRSARLDRRPAADTTEPDFWSEPYWGWTLSAGVPGVRYSLYLADRPLPEYFWLETRAKSLIHEQRSGNVVRQWRGRSLARDGNVGQSLDFRLGCVRYHLHWDTDVYATAIQGVELDELPAFFGHWGVGLLAAGEVAATRAWLDFADFGFSLARPTGYPSRFRLAFLRLEVAYRNLRSFQLGVALNVHMQNPIMNLPGAVP